MVTTRRIRQWAQKIESKKTARKKYPKTKPVVYFHYFKRKILNHHFVELPAEMSAASGDNERKDKSLGVLATKFMELLKENKGTVNLKHVIILKIKNPSQNFNLVFLGSRHWRSWRSSRNGESMISQMYWRGLDCWKSTARMKSS
jgi:hypothetical protein